MQPAMHQSGFRLSDLFDEDFQDRLLPLLSLSEVSALECTSRRSCEDLQQSALWERVACCQLLPRFHVPCPSPSTSETRSAVRQVVADLRAANVPRDTQPVTLSTFRLAQELAACCARARRVAAHRRAEHGAFMEIVVANFRFPLTTSTSPSLSDGTVYVSEPIVTSFLLGGVQQVWELRLALESRTVLLGSRREGGDQPPAAVGPSNGDWRDDRRAFVVDIHCVNNTFELHLFDMLIHPESDWTRGGGLFAVRNSGKIDLSTALRTGLLCVLCLRAVPSVQTRNRPYRDLNAMNLHCLS